MLCYFLFVVAIRYMSPSGLLCSSPNDPRLYLNMLPSASNYHHNKSSYYILYRQVQLILEWASRAGNTTLIKATLYNCRYYLPISDPRSIFIRIKIASADGICLR